MSTSWVKFGYAAWWKDWFVLYGLCGLLEVAYINWCSKVVFHLSIVQARRFLTSVIHSRIAYPAFFDSSLLSFTCRVTSGHRPSWLSTISFHLYILIFFLLSHLNTDPSTIYSSSLSSLCVVFISRICFQSALWVSKFLSRLNSFYPRNLNTFPDITTFFDVSYFWYLS